MLRATYHLLCDTKADATAKARDIAREHRKDGPEPHELEHVVSNAFAEIVVLPKVVRLFDFRGLRSKRSVDLGAVQKLLHDKGGGLNCDRVRDPGDADRVTFDIRG